MIIRYIPYANVENGTYVYKDCEVTTEEDIARGVASLYQNARRGMPRKFIGFHVDETTGKLVMVIDTLDTRSDKRRRPAASDDFMD